MNIDEMKDRIARAEEIQRYTENRCETLEKENAELKEQNNKAKEIIKKLISDNRKVWVYSDVREEAEQFLSSSENPNKRGGKMTVRAECEKCGHN